MKYVITNNKNVVMFISNTLKYQSNGYPIIDENGEETIIVKDLVKGIFRLEEIPEEIKPNEYCYTKEQGFYKNKDYKRYYSTEERISALEDTVNMLLGF